MTQTIKLISDCDAILASQIGPGAIDVLIEKGIDPTWLLPLLMKH